MWQIESFMYVIASMTLVINACCFFMWWEYKTVKSHKVQKNLAKYYKWSTLVMAVLLIGNAIILKVSGSYCSDPSQTLLYIIIQGAFGYGCTVILKKNYLEKMRAGQRFPFVIASIGTKISGYLVIGRNWIEAVVDNPVKKLNFLGEEAVLACDGPSQEIKCVEEQQVEATLVNAGSEDCEVVVRV